MESFSRNKGNIPRYIKDILRLHINAANTRSYSTENRNSHRTLGKELRSDDKLRDEVEDAKHDYGDVNGSFCPRKFSLRM